MPPDENNKFLDTAVKAAQRAGEFVLKNLGSLSKEDIGMKQAADFVTRVDEESEKIIITTIQEVFPDHAFLAEESASESETGDFRWIIDPLDGTTNFIHQYPVFSVSIALEQKREIIVGVIFDPSRKELFTAEKGEGAFLNNNAVTVSEIAAMNNGLITTGFPFRAKDMIDTYQKAFKDIFLNASDLRRAGSAALDLAYLASGRCDGFFEIGLSPWDIAAGSLMIQEAGGIVTDFAGGNDYLSTGNIVAGTQATHGELLKRVQKAFRRIIEK